jgi:hypothetical protein
VNVLLSLAEFGVPMKVVFRLEDELRKDSMRVQLAQALTLDASRPQMGLRGVHGLFGSPEWWASIRGGRIPLLRLSGVVQCAYVAGQDQSSINNTVDLMLKDGSIQSAGIYLNDTSDSGLFRPGCQVGIVYALDELKRQPAAGGGVNYSKIALEMAVSI